MHRNNVPYNTMHNIDTFGSNLDGQMVGWVKLKSDIVTIYFVLPSVLEVSSFPFLDSVLDFFAFSVESLPSSCSALRLEALLSIKAWRAMTARIKLLK